jgi:hypothetical protein
MTAVSAGANALRVNVQTKEISIGKKAKEIVKSVF